MPIILKKISTAEGLVFTHTRYFIEFNETLCLNLTRTHFYTHTQRTWRNGVQWKHSDGFIISSWMWCQPLAWVLGFAKTWLCLRQRTQTVECCSYSPLCAWERHRNAGCQASYTNTARGLEPWGKTQPKRPHSWTSLITSICDIIPILLLTVLLWSSSTDSGAAWLFQHSVSCRGGFWLNATKPLRD